MHGIKYDLVFQSPGQEPKPVKAYNEITYDDPISPYLVLHLSSQINGDCAYILRNGNLYGCNQEQYSNYEFDPDEFPKQLIMEGITKIIQINNNLSKEKLEEWNKKFCVPSK